MHYRSNYFRQVKSKVRSPFSSSLFLSPTQVSLYHQNTLLSLSSARSKKRGCSYITRASKCRNQKRNTSMVANTTAIPRICGKTWEFWVSSLGVSRRHKAAGKDFWRRIFSFSFVSYVPRSFVRIVHAEVLFYYFYYDTNQFDLRVTQTASSGRNFPWWTKLPSMISSCQIWF